MTKPIYLDYNATTPHAPEVIAAMRPFLEERFAGVERHEHSRRMGGRRHPAFHGEDDDAGGNRRGGADDRARREVVPEVNWMRTPPS